MELKRILARDTRSATEQAMALYGPDVLIISNNRVAGQTELVVALDVSAESAIEVMDDELPAVGGEQIALVADSLDPYRCGGVIPQLFAQARDGDVDTAIQPVVAQAPHQLQQ